VPQDQLKQRLVQLKKSSYKPCYAQSCQITIGKELAAQKTLSTSIIKLGSTCMVTSVVYDLKAAASEGGASVEGECTENGIVDSIKEVITQLGQRSQARASTSTTAKERGGVLIKTTPSGATVQLNNVQVAGVTPLTVSGLVPGVHLLEISKGDYRFAGRILVRANDYTVANIALRKETVRLEVVSDPPEATILFNGWEVGKTPRILPTVKVGEYTLELKKIGYLSETRTIRLGAGTPSQMLRVTLQRACYLKIQSDPPQAAVTVDGYTIKGRTPVGVKVVPGKHTVILSLDRHDPASRRIAVREGERVELNVALTLTKEERQKLARHEAIRTARHEASRRYEAALVDYNKRYDPIRRKSIWAYTALGTGVALVAASISLYVVGANQGNEAHDWYMLTAGYGPPNDPSVLEGYRNDIESARVKIAVGNVLVGLAAVAVGYSVYQLITIQKIPEAPTRDDFKPMIGVAPSTTGGALMLGGQF